MISESLIASIEVLKSSIEATIKQKEAEIDRLRQKIEGIR